MIELNQIYNENCLDTLRRMPDEFIDCVVTSPPYFGLRDYGHADQIGLEPTFQEYLDKMIEVFGEIKRVLKRSGTVWVNLGDSYNNRHKVRDTNHQPAINGRVDPVWAEETKRGRTRLSDNSTLLEKSLLNIPARFAIRMTDELQFIQRNEIVWHKPACMPSSATDRFTVDFEKIFFFTKSEKYYFEQQTEKATTNINFKILGRGKQGFATASVGNPQQDHSGGLGYTNGNGRNMRTTWTVPFEPQSESHYASYPTRLIETPIKAGCPVGGIVYEPFCGTGTTLVVAHKLGRNWIGSEISKEYCDIANKRLEPYLMQETLF